MFYLYNVIQIWRKKIPKFKNVILDQHQKAKHHIQIYYIPTPSLNQDRHLQWKKNQVFHEASFVT